MGIENLRDFGRGQLPLDPGIWVELDRTAQAAFEAEAVVRRWFDRTETKDLGATSVMGRAERLIPLSMGEFTFDLNTETPNHLLAQVAACGAGLAARENRHLLELVAEGEARDVPEPDLSVFSTAVAQLHNGARAAALLGPDLHGRVAGKVANGVSLRREAEALLGGGLHRTPGLVGGVVLLDGAKLGQLVVQWPGVHVCVNGREGPSRVRFDVVVSIAAVKYWRDSAKRLVPVPVRKTRK